MKSQNKEEKPPIKQVAMADAIHDFGTNVPTDEYYDSQPLKEILDMADDAILEMSDEEFNQRVKELQLQSLLTKGFGNV